MKTYTLYISSAFAIVLLIGAGNFIWYWRKYRTQLKQLRQHLQDNQ